METLIFRLFQVVSYGLTHAHYNKVVEQRKLYRQLVAGEGIDDLLGQFVRRESVELFEQRKKLTHHTVPSICASLTDVFYKVPNSNTARRVLAYTNDNAENDVTVLEKILANFHGAQSYEKYLATRFIDLNITDPNSFVVFEWSPFDNRVENIQPTPFEVSSVEAIDYKKVNAILQYLIVKNEIALDRPKKGLYNPTTDIAKGYKYTLYAPNQTVQLIQLSKELIAPINYEKGKIYQQTYLGLLINVVKLGENYYKYVEFEPHNLGLVHAFQVGYIRDLKTNGDTFVSPLHRVEAYLLKTIKAVSEMDLTTSLTAMPQMIAYAPQCEAIDCFNGTKRNGETCGTCKGSGLKSTAPSSQDAIVIAMPKNKDEFVPLESFVKYVHPPIEILDFQDRWIDKLVETAKKIMFNSDTFTQSSLSETATAKMIDMQNVDDTLKPFADKYSEVWEHGVKIMAALASRSQGLVAKMIFGKSLKLKTLSDLVGELQTAQTINNASLVRYIDEDIAQIIFAEKPKQLQKYLLKEFMNPFTGKSEKEITMLLATNLVTLEDKVLHANFERIFDELELEYTLKGLDLYSLTKEKQREAVYGKVGTLIESIQNAQPTLPLEIDNE